MSDSFAMAMRVCAIGALTLGGCIGGGGSGGGGGGGGGISGGATCSQFASKLRECGLLSPGTFPCDEPVDDAERCEARCVLDAQCGELDSLLCGADPGSATGLQICVQSCGGGESNDFDCGDGGTVPDHWVCDGDDDCADGSDETDCASRVLTCDGGEPVPDHAVCDGWDDCADGSDEAGCPMFQCDNGAAIPADYQCDEDDDCGDGSDEAGCAMSICR